MIDKSNFIRITFDQKKVHDENEILTCNLANKEMAQFNVHQVQSSLQ